MHWKEAIFFVGFMTIFVFGEWLTYRDLRRKGKKLQYFYGPSRFLLWEYWSKDADETVKTIINDGMARTVAMIIVYFIAGGIALHFIL